MTIESTNTISDAAVLTVDGDPSAVIDPETEDGAFLLDMQADETVGAFVVNGIAMDGGTYGKTGSGATYTGFNTALGFNLDLLFDDSLDRGGLGALFVKGVADAAFARGDSNGDGTVNIADAIATLGFLFGGAEAPQCLDSADANDDGGLNIADAIATLGFLFGGGGDLPPPFPGCGNDPTEDTLLDCVYPPENCP